MRIIYSKDNFRITEKPDDIIDLDHLKGDCFNPEHNPDIDPAKLKRDERDFERLVGREGVYGYTLERWNPEVGQGWEHVDSCWGFVGQYSEFVEAFNHYIVDEMKLTIIEAKEQPNEQE